MTHGWVYQGNDALRRRESLLGLPTRYAAVLIMLCMLLVLELHYVAAGVWIGVVGIGLGKAVCYLDPFGWEILAKNLTLPRRLLPS
jgi:hypothetical protein